MILTDSGGVQEEACILGVPCVTLRDNTERPETVAVGANVLAGAAPEKILSRAREMLAGKRRWENPFGDGKAAVQDCGRGAGRVNLAYPLTSILSRRARRDDHRGQ